METNKDLKMMNEEYANELSMKNIPSSREKLNEINEREFSQE
jgi:hypothetical protein